MYRELTWVFDGQVERGGRGGGEEKGGEKSWERERGLDREGEIDGYTYIHPYMFWDLDLLFLFSCWMCIAIEIHCFVTVQNKCEMRYSKKHSTSLAMYFDSSYDFP